MFRKEQHKQTAISRNAIFTTGSMRISKILPSLVLTLIIFLIDFNFNIGKDIKSLSLNIYSPVNSASQNIESFSDQVYLFFTSQNKLINTINEQEEKINSLNFQILKQSQLDQENKELLALMGFTKNDLISKFVAGEIQDKKFFPKESMSISVNTKIISKNMSVLNIDGLIGVVETIFPDKAKVIPIYSLGQIIPGLIERTSQNIILEGKGSKNSFFVKNIKNNSNIKVGDKIFTSGLGGKFPKGYLVGKVGIINDSEEKANLEVVVFSDANFDKGTKVLFIKP
ncbi:MAG: rod shape-determining protein MreC [Gammaproteobacteria bacterium]